MRVGDYGEGEGFARLTYYTLNMFNHRLRCVFGFPALLMMQLVYISTDNGCDYFMGALRRFEFFFEKNLLSAFDKCKFTLVIF